MKQKEATNERNDLLPNSEEVIEVPRSEEANRVSELEELMQQHLTKMKQLEAEHSVRLNELKNNYDKALEEAKEKLNKATRELEEVQSNHIVNLTEKETGHGSIVSELNDKLSVLKETYERTKIELTEAMNNLSNAQEAIDKRDHQIHELESASEKQKGEVEATTKRNETLSATCEGLARDLIDAQNTIAGLRKELIVPTLLFLGLA